MADILGLDSLAIAAGVFLAVFLVLLGLWSVFVRMLFSAFGKSKLYFLPQTLKELFFSVALVLLLVAVFAASMVVDRALLGAELFKIWEVLLIFALANIVVRVVLTTLDVQHRKAKDRSGLYRSVGLLKSTAGLILYFIAFLIAVYVLSAELGTAVMVMAFFVVMLLFAASFPQMKSVFAGLQLGDYYVDVGSLLSIDGRKGFVEGVYGRSTVVQTLDGKKVVIPNFHFFDRRFQIDPEEVSEVDVTAEISGKDPQKAKERLSSICSKVAIALPEMPNDFKPKVFQLGVRDGRHVFSMIFKVNAYADFRKAMDALSAELCSEFGERLFSLSADWG
jgi:small-conductance mechanosensitive channel